VKKCAVVAGAAGIIGRNLILYLSKQKDWDTIYALSRRIPDYESRAQHLSIDLLDQKETEAGTKKLTNVTHIFFAAYQEKPTLKEQIPPNLRMLVNLVEALEKVAPKLEHVALVEGCKWYGCHLGPFKTPAKEDDPRCMPPMFYFDQEDYLSSRVKAGHCKWAWSALRPNPVCGFALGNPMNLVTVLAVYGSICKELGLPLRFPGTATAYSGLLEVVDVEVLSKAMVWAATSPQCANQAFNCSNGDVFRWQNVWPSIAKFFQLDLDHGPFQPVSLVQMMADKENLWNEMVKKYNLRKTAYSDIAPWGFADWVFSREYDWFTDVNKARRFGFTEMIVDSEEMFVRMLKSLREDKIIP